MSEVITPLEFRNVVGREVQLEPWREAELDPWRLSSRYSIPHAAALIAGINPNSKELHNWQHFKEYERPHMFEAARQALMHDILAGVLSASVGYHARLQARDDFGGGEVFAKLVVISATSPDMEDDLEPQHYRRPKEGFVVCEKPDWEQTTVTLIDLRRWLESRGFRPPFFFPNSSDDTPGYLDCFNPNYSPKLAAAVHAWTTVRTNGVPKNMTVKKALTKVLNENAAEYRLTNSDGTPNATGIEEIAKVANWEPGGGAPRSGG